MLHRPAHSSGFLPSQERRGGAWVPARVGSVAGGPAGSGRTGVSSGTAFRRWIAPHLWIPAFAGTTVGVGGMTRDRDAPAPRPCPGFPRSRERRGGLGGEHAPIAPHLWIPAFAGTTVGGGGMTRDRDAPAPRPCPGFPRSRERRGGWRRAGAFVCPCRTGFDLPRGEGCALVGVPAFRQERRRWGGAWVLA